MGVEVRAEICTLADRTGLTGANNYPGAGGLLWLIATDDNYVGSAGPESLDGTAGTEMWDYLGRDNIRHPPVSETSNLLSDGSGEAGSPEGTPVPDPPPGECVNGYVQIDLPDDATSLDVIVALAQRR